MSDGEKQFGAHLLQLVNGGMGSLGIALGLKLNLFDAVMDTANPGDKQTSQQIADKANLRERYVREWLALMVCHKIIEVDETGTKFWVAAEKRSALAKETRSSMLTMTDMCVQSFAEISPLVQTCFHKDGPTGTSYDDYANFHMMMAALNGRRHSAVLISQMLPLAGQEWIDKLTAGIRVLDVGCGHGLHARLMAEAFPNSTFTGFDIVASAVEEAARASKHLTNLSFVCFDGRKMPDEWTNTFDFVTIFDACHDQARPDLCMKEVHRCLKADGLCYMTEVQGTSNLHRDSVELPMAGFCYGCSLFHCMPIALKEEDGLGLGAMWGKERAIEMFNNCGFSSVRTKPLKDDPINQVFLCQK